MTRTADIADPLSRFGTIMHGKTPHFLELDRVQVVGCVTKYEAAEAAWKMATQYASQLIIGDTMAIFSVSVSLEAESRQHGN
ncbi:unnamed protein product [Clonostachys rosea]|uniref:Uncharacterized protein n=1 Tax=Bionectria ochroleuca TaxID=29856 RepID=A0ABY6UX07_BIOOC|nr:unnamed protein product [Clonostachys rosea]